MFTVANDYTVCLKQYVLNGTATANRVKDTNIKPKQRFDLM
jgi:hypothetical protein